jgi:hypothetical protein
MQLAKFINHVCATDLLLVISNEPWKPCFEQREDPFNKRLGIAIVFVHTVLLEQSTQKEKRGPTSWLILSRSGV